MAKPSHDGTNDDGKKQLRKVSGDIHVHGEIKTTLPSELVKEIASSNQKTDAREDKRFTIEKITLIAVLIVALLTLISTLQNIKSADAAKSAAETAKDALVNGQRAVVSPETFTVARQHDADAKIDALQFTVGWKNSGPTTTKNLETWSNWRFFPPNMKVDKTFNFTDIWPQSGKPVPHEKGFAATQALRTYYPMTVPKPLIEAVNQGNAVLLFWGRAPYQDVFSKDVHTTEYCLTVVGFDGATPFDPRWEAGTTYPRFISCPIHNCQDEECKAT